MESLHNPTKNIGLAIVDPLYIKLKEIQESSCCNTTRPMRLKSTDFLAKLIHMHVCPCIRDQELLKYIFSQINLDFSRNIKSPKSNCKS